MLPLFILGICSLWVRYFLQIHIIDFCNYLVLSFSFKMLTLICVFFGVLVFGVFQFRESGFLTRDVSVFFNKVSLLLLWFKSIRFLSFGSGDSISSRFMSIAKGVVLVNVEKG
jgi:hypothetical protein